MKRWLFLLLLSVPAFPQTVVQTKLLDCTTGCSGTKIIVWNTRTLAGSTLVVTGWTDFPLPNNAFTYNTGQYMVNGCTSFTPTDVTATKFGASYYQIRTLPSSGVTITQDPSWATTWHGKLLAYEISGANINYGSSCFGTATGTTSSITTNLGSVPSGGFSVGVIYNLANTPAVTGQLTTTDSAFANGAIFNSGGATGTVNYGATYASVSGAPGIVMTTFYNGSTFNAAYPPVMTPGPGNYGSAVDVAVTEPMLGTTLRCTTDGSTPNSGSTPYSGTPFHITTTTTISCYAQGTAGITADSPVTPFTYVINANPQTTWYVRPAGGTRTQCTGKTDADYPGTGTAQACAFNDWRWLWDDQTFGGYTKWIGNGGDTYVIRGCATATSTTSPVCPVGYETGSTPGGWCFGTSIYACENPPIPSGTAINHTKILSSCGLAGTCNSGNTTIKANLQKLNGQFGVFETLNLRDTGYVDIAGFDIGSQGNCIVHGSPNPNPCNTGSSPLSNYVQDGINTDQGTHDITMTDLWIHGNTDRGVKGAIGGTITCQRCNIDTNGEAGWDFDQGDNAAPSINGTPNQNGTPSVNGQVNFFHSTIQFSGCNQEYPYVHTYPVEACYDQQFGGYGDAMGSPPGTSINLDFENSQFLFNTQDAPDLGHADAGRSGAGYYDMSSATLISKNNYAHGNEGAAGVKSGPQYSSYTLENNVLIGNCQVMGWPLTGAPGITITAGAISAGVASWTNSGTNGLVAGQLVSFGNFSGAGLFLNGYGGTNGGGGGFIVSATGLTSSTFQTNTDGSWPGTVAATGTGTASTWNATLGSLCRSGDALSMNVHAVGQVSIINNTLITYFTGSHLLKCWENDYFCPGSKLNFQNNITFGIQDALAPLFNDYGGNNGGIGGWFFNDDNFQAGAVGSVTGGTNQWFGVRTGTLGLAGDLISDVLFNGETSAWSCTVSGGSGCTFAETTLNGTFPPTTTANFVLTSSSPAKAAGTVISGLTADFFGNAYQNPPSMGAVQFGTPPVNSPTFLRGVVLKGVTIQ